MGALAAPIGCLPLVPTLMVSVLVVFCSFGYSLYASYKHRFSQLLHLQFCCACVHACVCARARVCVCMCVCVCVYVCGNEFMGVQVVLINNNLTVQIIIGSNRTIYSTTSSVVASSNHQCVLLCSIVSVE